LTAGSLTNDSLTHRSATLIDMFVETVILLPPVLDYHIKCNFIIKR